MELVRDEVDETDTSLSGSVSSLEVLLMSRWMSLEGSARMKFLHS